MGRGLSASHRIRAWRRALLLESKLICLCVIAAIPSIAGAGGLPTEGATLPDSLGQAPQRRRATASPGSVRAGAGRRLTARTPAGLPAAGILAAGSAPLARYFTANARHGVAADGEAALAATCARMR
jgi:hypothetical protein